MRSVSATPTRLVSNARSAMNVSTPPPSLSRSPWPTRAMPIRDTVSGRVLADYVRGEGATFYAAFIPEAS